jgi:hypothetical protein
MNTRDRWADVFRPNDDDTPTRRTHRQRQLLVNRKRKI